MTLTAGKPGGTVHRPHHRACFGGERTTMLAVDDTACLGSFGTDTAAYISVRSGR